MSIDNLYEKLAVNNIRLWKENSSLKYKGPAGSFSDTLKEEVRKNKQEILDTIDNFANRYGGLSYNQQALWFLNKVEPNSCSYNVVLAFSIVKDFNPQQVHHAFNNLVKSYPLLRATFPTASTGEAYMKTSPFQEVTVDTVEVSESGQLSKTTVVKDFCRLSFNLGADIPARACIFHAAGQDSLVVLVFHHIVCDAISLDILVSDFFGFYSGNCRHNSDLTDSWSQYLDFIDDQYTYRFNQDKRDPLAEFWKNELKNIAATVEYPFNVDRYIGDSAEGVSHGFLIDQELRLQLEASSRKIGVTKTVLVLYAFEVALEYILNLNNIAVGILTSGRIRSEYRRTIGYFVNPTPLNVEVDFEIDTLVALKQLSRKLQQLAEKSDYPFGLVVEDINVKRDFAANPVFQIAFNYISRQAAGVLGEFVIPGEDSVEVGGVAVKPVYISQQNGQFDMTFEVIESTKSDFWNIKYKKNIFDEETIKRIAKCIQYIAQLVATAEADDIAVFLKNYKIKGKTQKEAQQLVIASNFTSENMKADCEYWFKRINFPATIDFAPYNQVFQELLNPSSMFASNGGGFNVALIRLEEWLSSEEMLLDRTRFDEIFDEFIQSTEAYISRSKTPLFVFFLPYSDRLYSDEFTVELVQSREADYFNRFAKSIKIILSDSLKKKSSVGIIDPVALEAAHVPFTSQFYSLLSMEICRNIWGYKRKPYKVIVLDCDNTLWRGVVAEQGVHGIIIDDEFRSFQEYLVKLEEKGIILCLVSKNNEEDVLKAFRARRDMPLNLEKISSYRINWESKSSNIRSLAAELNLNPDSFIFIDDNPVECAEVKAIVPEVFVLNIAEDMKNRSEFLSHLWPLALAAEGSNRASRTEFYKSQAKREHERAGVATLTDFIARLDLKVENRQSTEQELARVSELSFRVNQFNFTAKTFADNEIIDYFQKEDSVVSVTKASDKFGNYGIIGAAVCKKRRDILTIENLFISCRALGKGIEAKTFSYLGKLAQDYNCSMVSFTIKETGKNVPAIQAVNRFFKDFIEEQKDTIHLHIPVRYLIETVPQINIFEADKPSEETTKTIVESVDIDPQEALFIDIANEILNTNNRSNSKIQVFTGSIENSLADVWSRVLRKTVKDYKANFFELGGTSLMIPEILSILKNERNISIEIVDLFKYPTIQSLSTYCQSISQHDVIAEESKNSDSERHDVRKKRLEVQNRFKRARSR